MASLKVKDGTTWKSAIPWVKDGSTWKKPKTLWVKDGSTWKAVWVAFSATVSSTLASAFGSPTTDSVTASPSGGTGPYSYSWAWATNDDVITINSGSSA